jgi:colanic acid biosynthesis protein WcaH
MIPADQYREILERMPLLCVDVIVTNGDGEILLVKRVNEPLKGSWWVPGGRVLKGESLEEAARRKVLEETALSLINVAPVGYYESLFREDPLELTSGLHAVSVVFQGEANAGRIELDDQSSDYRFSNELPQHFHIHYFKEWHK